MKKLLAPLILCLALIGAGCGGDDEKSDSGGGGGGGGESAAKTSEGGGAKPAGGEVLVDMKNIKYVPADVTVKKGGTVKWTNNDGGIPHTVTKQDGPGKAFDSGNMDGDGATYEQKFDAPGKVSYFCTIHPNQKGSVTVK